MFELCPSPLPTYFGSKMPSILLTWANFSGSNGPLAQILKGIRGLFF